MKRTHPEEYKPESFMRWKRNGFYVLTCGHLSWFWVWNHDQATGWCARCRQIERDVQVKREYDIGGES